MKKNHPFENLLHLSKNERAVYDTLKKEAMLVARLSKQTKIPRTTLYTTLPLLLARGLISKEKRGRRTYYAGATDDVVEKSVAEMLGQFSSHNPSYHIDKKVGRYTLHVGVEKLVKVYETFSTLPRYSRIYGIQPNTSAISVMKKFPYEKLVRINKRIQQRKIIVEAILEENFLDVYAKKLKEHKKPVHDIFEAYGKRLADTTHVPAGSLSFDSEIMATPHTLFFVNWNTEVCVEINDPEIIGIFLTLFSIAKMYGKKVDQNPAVEEIVKRHLA